MIEFLVVVLCLILNALFSAFEMAFVSFSKIEMRRHARDGNAQATHLLRVREVPERTLSVIQIGITLVGAVSAAVGGAGASEFLEPYFVKQLKVSAHAAEILSIISVVLPITYFSVVVGELVPKSLALRHATKISLWGARPIALLDKVLGPVISLLEKSTRLLLKTAFSNSPSTNQPPVSAVEISEFTKQHQQYILNLASIERKQVKDVFVPWKEVVAIDLNDSIEHVTHTIFTSGHTRLPVTQHGASVGVIHSKEFFALKETGANDWTSILRAAPVVRPNDPALSVLKALQGKRSHLAVVGECEGIVTLEDITMEIWGEFSDEIDDGRIKKLLASRVRNRTQKS